MTRKLFRLSLALIVLSALASATDAFAGHRGVRGVFGGVRAARHVTRDRHVERSREPLLGRFRAGAGCAGVVAAGGCIGTVSAAPRVVSGGCSGYGGPAMAAPAVNVVPMPLPKK